ncbi:MAG: TFIIB-type zinc ribbon-containing protein, partial [archaeon]
MAGNVCPECGSTKLRKDSEKGEIVCTQCGLIVSEDEMDFGKEWRSFDSDGFEDSARTGSPMKYVKLNKGLVTVIDRRGADARGNKLSSKSKAQMYRLIKWHKRASISSSMQRNLSIALTELRRVASYLNIPEQLVEAAALLYRKTVKKGLIRGRLIEAVVAAVLYTVCR